MVVDELYRYVFMEVEWPYDPQISRFSQSSNNKQRQLMCAGQVRQKRWVLCISFICYGVDAKYYLTHVRWTMYAQWRSNMRPDHVNGNCRTILTANPIRLNHISQLSDTGKRHMWRFSTLRAFIKRRPHLFSHAPQTYLCQCRLWIIISHGQRAQICNGRCILSSRSSGSMDRACFADLMKVGAPTQHSAHISFQTRARARFYFW